MNGQLPNDHTAPSAGPSTAKPVRARSLRDRTDHFLKLMLYQDRDWTDDEQGSGRPDRATGEYAALKHSMAKRGTRYTVPQPRSAAAVRLDSPATEVMTDLRRISAATTGSDTSIEAANRVMIARAVRALFVTDDARQVLGIITSTDIQGEKPIQIAQERRMRHGDVLVRDIMTPADRLEVLDYWDVERSSCWRRGRHAAPRRPSTRAGGRKCSGHAPGRRDRSRHVLPDADRASAGHTAAASARHRAHLCRNRGGHRLLKGCARRSRSCRRSRRTAAAWSPVRAPRKPGCAGSLPKG